MKPYIKICGVTNDQDLKELVKLDIDAIGFNRDKDSPPIKFCIPPISGGKFLVDITNII